MRRLAVLAALACLAATGAHAAYYIHRIGSYYIAGNVIEPVRPAAYRVPPRDVFFTPAPSYRRPGYTCLPLSQVTIENGREVAREGTVCKADGI